MYCIVLINCIVMNCIVRYMEMSWCCVMDGWMDGWMDIQVWYSDMDIHVYYLWLYTYAMGMHTRGLDVHV